MAKSKNAVPVGMHTVTPHLIIREAAKAIEFYKKAFGATEQFVMPAPDGKIMHAQIQIGDSLIMLNDECAEWGNLGPESRGGPTGSLMLYLDNVDAAFDRAVQAGCTVVMPVQDMFWGDRWGQVTDPFGHRWALAMHIEDVSLEDMQKRSAQMFKDGAGCGQ